VLRGLLAKETVEWAEEGGSHKIQFLTPELKLTSSPCLADTTNHEKEPEMAGLLDRVRPRHLAAWRSSFAWSGCGDSQPDN